MANTKFQKDPPMLMRTIHMDGPWSCPWCRKSVAAGELHEDRAADKFGRVETKSS